MENIPVERLIELQSKIESKQFILRLLGIII